MAAVLLPGQEGPGEPVADPSPRRFSVCLLHGCRRIAETGLTPVQWGPIRDLFFPPARDAAAERERIARAIGLMETLVSGCPGAAGERGGAGGPGEGPCPGV